MDNKPTVQAEQSITAGMNREQIDLIKATVARGATDDELKLFLYTANRTQLDPLTKQSTSSNAAYGTPIKADTTK